MLNLKLRDEFLGTQMPGTAIALRRADNSGAAQQGPEQILRITYPTADVQTALRALSEKRPPGPIVLMGDRGRGKSHIMAVMHHAVQSPDLVESWARGWGQRPGMEALKDITLQRGFFAVSEPVHNHEYPLLWDLLFDRHPKGQFYKGKFEQLSQPYPPRSLLEDMFQSQPVALILDEFQRWFDGLHDDSGATGRKWREAASNFIQNLSEISKDRPDILILAISVLTNTTEAFRQVHRDGPVVINFQGPTAKQDRQQLLLHRLFANRDNVPKPQVQQHTAAYASERYRLRYSHLPESERDRIVLEVIDSWPFAPELLDLLDNQILLAEAAQETRDLIRILASAYRARGEDVPLITPADFFVDDDASGVQSLLDSIATSASQLALREVAQRNLDNVYNLGVPVPHARELVSALWMHSMSPVRKAGATRQELQLDITRESAQDTNAFESELALLIDNSINIHGWESPQGQLWFGQEENARSKVKTTARNHKLWQAGASASALGQTVYVGEDIKHIRNTLRHLLTSETKQTTARVVVLGPSWEEDPWPEVEEADRPDRWDRPVLLVVPSPLGVSNGQPVSGLGGWLVTHVPARRNTIRFLLPAPGSNEIYQDQDLILAARCSYLTSIAWRDDAKYLGLKNEFDKPLRDTLKDRFDRFAVLRNWDFQHPSECEFDVERIEARGDAAPGAVETKILSDLFDRDEFEKRVIDCAKGSKQMDTLLKDLVEPPASPSIDAVPYLGDVAIYEEVLKLAAKGKIALNVGGTWVSRQAEHTDDQGYQHVRSKAFRTGAEMRQVQLALPGAVGGSPVSAPANPVTAPKPTATTVQTQPGTEYPFGNDETGQPYKKMNEPPVTSVPALKVLHTDSPASGINLLGYFEKWGLPADKVVTSAKIELTGVSVQQLKQVIQKLQSTLKASLEVTYEEEMDQ